MKLPRSLVLASIGVYQRFISPLFPASCRFHPSCSQYAMDAIRVYGLFRGSWLATRRIARCHPWNPGGVDPVVEGRVNTSRPEATTISEGFKRV